MTHKAIEYTVSVINSVAFIITLTLNWEYLGVLTAFTFKPNVWYCYVAQLQLAESTSCLCPLWAIHKGELTNASAQPLNHFSQSIRSITVICIRVHLPVEWVSGNWLMVVTMQLLNSTFVSSLLWMRDLFRLLKTLSKSRSPQLKWPIKLYQNLSFSHT